MRRTWTLAGTTGALVTLGTLSWAAGEGAHQASGAWSHYGPLAWNIGNFAILAYLLYRFGRKKVADYFFDREERIRSNLQRAEKALAEAEEKARFYLEKLEAVDREIEHIIAELKEEGEAEKKRIIETAQQAVHRMKEEAHRAAQEEVNRAVAILREEMVSRSVQLAQDLIQRNLTAEDQRHLVRQYLNRMAERS